VYVAVQLYEALRKVADEQGIVLREGDYVSDMGKTQMAKAGIPSESTSPLRSPSPLGGVQPSHLRAIERFIEGFTCAEIAEEGGIKVGTVR